MKQFIALLLVVFVAACSAAPTSEPVGDVAVAQEIQEIESLEADLAEIGDLESELNFDELDGLDEELVFE